MSTDVSKNSQTMKILDYMRQGNRINPKLALEKFGCFRLAARIADIERRGHIVNGQMVIVKKENETVRYKEYWLDE